MTRAATWLLLLSIYAAVFGIVLDRNRAWMSAEAVNLEFYALRTGLDFTRHDWKRGLDYNVLESGPRLTRPLASWLTIADAKLRASLWRFVPPHPSFSITWLFSLFLSPLCLYLLLCNLGLTANASLLAVALYLVSPGNLSVVALLFRPSKPMTSFALLLCLWLGSRVERGGRRAFTLLLAVTFTCFFWDETALLLYPTLAIFFPDQMLRRDRLPAFLALPFLVVLFDFLLLPYLAHLLGYPFPRLTEFSAIAHPNTHGVRGFIVDTIANARLFFSQSFAWLPPLEVLPPLERVLLAANAVVLAALALLRARHREPLSSRSLRLWLYLGGLCVAHTVLMTAASWQVAPIYWYGCYWSVIFVPALALTLGPLGERPIGMVSTALLSVALLVSFLHLHETARHYFFDVPLEGKSVLRRQMRESSSWFLLPELRSARTAAFIDDYWKKSLQSGKLPSLDLPPELAFLPVEMGALLRELPQLNGPHFRQALNYRHGRER